jgi:hypothetical protein
MLDPASGYQNSYRSSPAIRPQSNSSSVNGTKGTDGTDNSEPPKGAGNPLSFLLHGDPDKRAPDEKPENQHGMVTGVLSGILNGLKDSVSNLFSWKGS